MILETGRHYDKTTRLEILASIATDGHDMGHLESEFRHAFSVDDVRSILYSEGIRWGGIVESDVQAILAGQPIQFFLQDLEWAELYRNRRGVPLQPPKTSTMREAAAASRTRIERWRRQYETHGVTTAMLDNGCACYPEQRYFYGTPEWTNRARLCRYLSGYSCDRCGARDVELHAHHLSPIITVFALGFHRNFDGYCLETLCAACHKDYHSKTVRAGFSFRWASPERVGEERQWLPKQTRLHNLLGTCQFCSSGIAKLYPNE